MIHETLGEDSRGFTRFWRGFARIHKTLEEDLRDFGRGFTRNHETLGEDLQ